MTTTSVGSVVAGRIMAGVCMVADAGGLRDDCDKGGDGGGDARPSPDPTATPGPDDMAFQPKRCILGTETARTRTVLNVLIFEIVAGEEVKITQWSDGTVTADYTSSVGGGVGGGLDFTKLETWNGRASLGGSFTKSSGSGGRWLFDKHNTGDPQKDLELNHRDAKNFIEYLRGLHECRRMGSGRGAQYGLGMVCNYHNKENNLPDLPPAKMPDLDLTRTTIEASGEFKLGGAVSKNGKTVVSGQGKGIEGTVRDDVLVMRGGGEITFVYTMKIGGKMGTGFQASGGMMQQVYATYDAAAYERQEKKGKPHSPKRIRITKAERAVGGGPGGEGKVKVPTGAINVQVEGGGGKIDTTVHTEVAELNLTDPQHSRIVEDWLRGRGDNPSSGLPWPSDFTQSLPPDSSDFSRLMHDHGKISSLDYNVNIDWWRAGWAIGLGFSKQKYKWSDGFKLLGMEISSTNETQELTGEPLFAGAPRDDGSRPWLPFTNCSQVEPVS